jgi:hypothetical protein
MPATKKQQYSRIAPRHRSREDREMDAFLSNPDHYSATDEAWAKALAAVSEQPCTPEEAMADIARLRQRLLRPYLAAVAPMGNC